MTEPEPEPPTASYVVTCETDGCGNAGIAIPIDTAQPESGLPNVVCGVCSQPITNIEVREVTAHE